MDRRLGRAGNPLVPGRLGKDLLPYCHCTVYSPQSNPRVLEGFWKDLTHCDAMWRHDCLFSIGFGNGKLPDGIKPLPEQIIIEDFMMTSSDGNVSALLAMCAGEFTVQRPGTRSFDVFFYAPE